MKYKMYKVLTDRNPDGSVSYSQEDMEIIADEHQFEQNFIKDYLGEAYGILLNEIRKRIVGIAEFAYNDENEAVHLMVDSGKMGDGRYFVRISISLWGEALNQHQVCKCGEKIADWVCDQATTSHTMVFTLDVDKEFVFKVQALFD
jgi:hypothetical protein